MVSGRYVKDIAILGMEEKCITHMGTRSRGGRQSLLELSSDGMERGEGRKYVKNLADV